MYSRVNLRVDPFVFRVISWIQFCLHLVFGKNEIYGYL